MERAPHLSKSIKFSVSLEAAEANFGEGLSPAGPGERLFQTRRRILLGDKRLGQVQVHRQTQSLVYVLLQSHINQICSFYVKKGKKRLLTSLKRLLLVRSLTGASSEVADASSLSPSEPKRGFSCTTPATQIFTLSELLPRHQDFFKCNVSSIVANAKH